MNLQLMRQNKKAALDRAAAAMAQANKENRLPTAEEQKDYDAAMADASGWQKQIENAEALQAAERTAPAVAAVPGAVLGHNNAEDKPWASLAEQMAAVRMAAMSPHRTDERLKAMAAAQGANETADADGGFLVAPEFAGEIIRRTFETGLIASRCRTYPMASNRLVMLGVKDDDRSNGMRNGGVATFWTREADLYQKSRTKFREIALQTDKLTALTFATDELLADAPAFQAFINDVVPDELNYKVDDAIWGGDGTSGPQGISKSKAIVVVPAESGQAANTIVTNNIQNMWSRLPGRLRLDACWLINQDVEPELWDLMRGNGAAAEALYKAPGEYGNTGPWGMIMGRPVILIEQAASLGDQGDITLASFSQYLLGRKGGIKQDTSIHVAFDTGEVAFRWQMRVAGQSLWDKAVTPRNGSNKLSPFIQLAQR